MLPKLGCLAACKLRSINLSNPGVIPAEHQSSGPIHRDVEPVSPAYHTRQVGRPPYEPADKPGHGDALGVLRNKVKRAACEAAWTHTMCSVIEALMVVCFPRHSQAPSWIHTKEASPNVSRCTVPCSVSDPPMLCSAQRTPCFRGACRRRDPPW